MIIVTIRIQMIILYYCPKARNDVLLKVIQAKMKLVLEILMISRKY